MRYKYRRYFLYYLGRVAAFLAYMLPIRVASEIAAFFGGCVFYILPEYRKITIDNLTHAFGSEKSTRQIRRIARRVFENLGRNAAELINFPKINKENIDRFIKIEGIDIVDSSFAKGNGTL